MPDWNHQWLSEIADHITDIGVNEFGMNPFPARIELVDAEEMLDIYSTTYPRHYSHWRYGKKFLSDYVPYMQGKTGLAYEVIINTNPSVICCMATNSKAMMALVVAHAGIGHSHVFRNNYLFKDYGTADSILDYVDFARKYVAECEDRYGVKAVEEILDAAHSIENQSMQPLKKSVNWKQEKERFAERMRKREEEYREVWQTVPNAVRKETSFPERPSIQLPQNNLLYFIEKYSPILLPWQKELVRIVRKMAQEAYPSYQMGVVHESAAVYSHFRIMERLHEKGLIDDGMMLECIHSTGHVVYQSEFNHWNGWNIYALGWAVAKDIERICLNPTEEDKKWFYWAGNNDPHGTLRDAWDNYRNESFIRQFMSPKVIRDFRMFELLDQHEESYYEVTAIHDDDGYRRIRSTLADAYLPERMVPDIQITAAAMTGDRTLTLTHYTDEGWPLHFLDRDKTMRYVKRLWGYPIRMQEVTRDGAHSIKAAYVVE